MCCLIAQFPRRYLLVAAVILPACLTSCRITSRHVADTQQTRKYERLEIIYQAHPASGPIFAAASDEIVPASHVSADTLPFQNMAWSKAELRIECPHPDGRPDVAHVTLRFRPVDCGQQCERRSWGENREERAETRQSRRSTRQQRWFYKPPAVTDNETVTELELPRSELEAILAELNSHDFFEDSGSANASESQLEVRLNHRWTSRSWGYEPSLDALTSRVYHEGVTRQVQAPEPSTKPGPGWVTSLLPHGHSK